MPPAPSLASMRYERSDLPIMCVALKRRPNSRHEVCSIAAATNEQSQNESRHKNAEKALNAGIRWTTSSSLGSAGADDLPARRRPNGCNSNSERQTLKRFILPPGGGPPR